MGIITLFLFWSGVVRLWIVDGPKLPLIYSGLWLSAFIGVPVLGLNGYFFLALEAILVVFLIITERYKSVTSRYKHGPM